MRFYRRILWMCMKITTIPGRLAHEAIIRPRRNPPFTDTVLKCIVGAQHEEWGRLPHSCMPPPRIVQYAFSNLWVGYGAVEAEHPNGIAFILIEEETVMGPSATMRWEKLHTDRTEVHESCNMIPSQHFCGTCVYCDPRSTHRSSTLSPLIALKDLPSKLSTSLSQVCLCSELD